MRKSITVLIVALVALSAVAGYVWKGAGVIVTSTTAPLTTLVTGTNYCYALSVYNSGTETAFFTLATSTNSFVAADSIPLPGGLTWTDPGSDGQNELKGRRITSITHATTNATTSLVVSFK